ncbi:MAG: hypothetical protein ACON4T_09095 [Synechococcus sp.]
MPRSANQASNAGDLTAAQGMAAPEFLDTPTNRGTPQPASSAKARRRRSPSPQRSQDNSDVLVSAVISTYLLTHLHHVLQRAEFGAVQEGRQSQAANYAQLRKVLCVDARSMEEASATGLRDSDLDRAA